MAHLEDASAQLGGLPHPRLFVILLLHQVSPRVYWNFVHHYGGDVEAGLKQVSLHT